MRGYISLHRKIVDHWLWKDSKPKSKLEAFIDLLLTANHKGGKVIVKNTIVECRRGDCLRSLETWADRWCWNKSKVRRFFQILETDNMIIRHENKETTHLTICNYESYQSYRHSSSENRHANRHTDETQTDTVKPNDNNGLQEVAEHKRNANRNTNETQTAPENNENKLNKEESAYANNLNLPIIIECYRCVCRAHHLSDKANPTYQIRKAISAAAQAIGGYDQLLDATVYYETEYSGRRSTSPEAFFKFGDYANALSEKREREVKREKAAKNVLKESASELTPEQKQSSIKTMKNVVADVLDNWGDWDKVKKGEA